MDTATEEKHASKNSTDIVPVHNIPANVIKRSKNESQQSRMKVKDEESKEIEKVPKIDDGDMSAWLWGGSLGNKGTVLVFRSCVLATKERTIQVATPKANSTLPSFSRTGLHKKKHLTKRISLESAPKDSVLKPLSEPLTPTAAKWAHKSIDNSEINTDADAESSANLELHETHDVKRKRDIRDVLNDINNITLKKKLNINNSTAHISNASKCPDEQSVELKSDTAKNGSSKSSLTSIPSIHKAKKKPDSLAFPTVTQPNSSNTSLSPATKGSNSSSSLSLDSISNSVLDMDYKNIKIPDKNEMPAALLHITYKTAMTETKLLSRMLQAHGFTDVDLNSKEFNLMWSGLHPKPDVLRSLAAHQRVNHFPRSYELTRKDKLFKNIEKMQYFRGPKNFDFIPMTFIMPIEYKELCTTHYRLKGPWIVKPAASSRGRGIYIVNAPDQIPKGESVVVAKYIDKPLLVDGHKCDLRLYVCVTSFDPLLIYMYEEGLVRFATVKYDRSSKNLWNPCMHLCNYSINKYHSDYIKCDDPAAENVGHKWTLSALLRHLRDEGRDTGALMSAIEDVVVKSILSCTQSIASASRMFVPYFNNCFELYGFDILIDETLKPWLLEINLSPSLGCDSPLDARLKSSLLADTLTLVGIPAINPIVRSESTQSSLQTNKSLSIKTRIGGYRRVHSAENMSSSCKKGFSNTSGNNSNGATLLTSEESRIVKLVKAQYQRRGGFVRIFPSQDSWQKYAQYLDPVTGVPVCSISVKIASAPNSLIPHNYNLLVHSHVLPHFDQSVMSTSVTSDPPERLKRYERVLPVCVRVSLESSNPNSAAGTSSRGSPLTKNNVMDSKSAKTHVKQQLQHGMHLTLGESRRAFGTFLNFVLKRLSNSTSEQSAHHADLVLRFLKRASNSLKMPYNLKSPAQKMSDKDKAAVIAKQLNDFLYIYHRETDLYTTSVDQRDCISNMHFAQFMYGASEADLEDILLTVLKKEGNIAPFLGDKLSPLCVDLPPPVAGQQPAKSLPSRTHQLLRYLTYVTPVHSRRYKAPSPERTSLPVLPERSTPHSNN